jgi:hypothetical protein
VALQEIISEPSIDTDLQAAEIWGYEGTINSDHEGIFPGMRVRIEVQFETDNFITDRPVRADVPVLEQSS